MKWCAPGVWRLNTSLSGVGVVVLTQGAAEPGATAALLLVKLLVGALQQKRRL